MFANPRLALRTNQITPIKLRQNRFCGYARAIRMMLRIQLWDRRIAGFLMQAYMGSCHCDFCLTSLFVFKVVCSLGRDDGGGGHARGMVFFLVAVCQ